MFMEVIFNSKGDFNNIDAWLKRVSSSSPNAILEQIAMEGERSLYSNTPKRTGQTAAGWQSIITSEKDNAEIAWINTAHPETSVSVAKLIELGHGTRTHGYVPPQPYISKSMDDIFNTAGDKIAEELTK